MVPSPDSATGSHWRCEHSGQNSLGGTARAPHRPQRTAVSCPSRAFSKKWRSVITGSVTAEERHEHGGGVAAERVSETDPGAIDLPPGRLAPQLGDHLGDLGGAGGADGVPLGLEAARRVDGNLATQARPPLLGGGAAGAGLEQAEPF